MQLKGARLDPCCKASDVDRTPQVDLPEDPNLRELTSAKPAFINTPKDGNSPRSEPGSRLLPSADGGESFRLFPRTL